MACSRNLSSLFCVATVAESRCAIGLELQLTHSAEAPHRVNPEAMSGCAYSMGDNSPSDDARIVGQTRQARVCGGGDHRMLRSLANTGQEVIVTVPESHLQHMAEFRDEARLWVAANVAPFLPATMITHVLEGDDVLSPVSLESTPPTRCSPPWRTSTPPSSQPRQRRRRPATPAA
ncbi:hypothetical protein ZWY2020_032431 [Hordeum vulgare]|nr:hypothetical protein ZWY2020_032431 [Hordeum vulgare]